MLDISEVWKTLFCFSHRFRWKLLALSLEPLAGSGSVQYTSGPLQPGTSQRGRSLLVGDSRLRKCK
eukprot:jgi/Botrbrau1/6868/Bobra.152_2s0026.1